MKELEYPNQASSRHSRESVPVCLSRTGHTPGESAIRPTLAVVSGQAQPGRFHLGRNRFRIGRSPGSDLVLNDGKVSRNHAQIYYEEGYYVIEDLDSTNGLQVNDLPVHKMLLKSGDRITLGDSQLVFTQTEPALSLGEKIAFINQSNLLSWLDQDTKILLAQNLIVRFFHQQALILAENTFMENMVFIYSGEIRLVEVNEFGDTREVQRLHPGDHFGEESLGSGNSGHVSLIAGQDLTLLELRRERLKELWSQNPELRKAFQRLALSNRGTSSLEPERPGRPGALPPSDQGNRQILTPNGLPGVPAVPAGRSLWKERY